MTNLDYLYNPAAAQKFFGKDHFVDKVLHFQIIERGTILPHKHMYINGQWTWGFGGIVDQRGEFVKSSFVANDRGEAYTPTEEVQYNPATVVYLGLFYPVWGHAITDNIRRLWFLKSKVFKTYFKDCPLVYVAWGGVMALSNRKIFDVCWRFWKSTLTGCKRLITPRNLKTSSCPTNRFTWQAEKNSPPNIARRLTA